MRALKRKRVVAIAFVAAHFFDVSPASTGTTPVDAFVPVPPIKLSGRFLRIVSRGGVPILTTVSGRLTRITADPLCTVTVSLLRDTRRVASAALVSVAFADGRPPWGAALPTTERATITAVRTDPAAEVPATGAAPGMPSGTSESSNGGPVEPVAVSAS